MIMVRVWINLKRKKVKLKIECEKQGYLYLTPETIFTENILLNLEYMYTNTKNNHQYNSCILNMIIYI